MCASATARRTLVDSNEQKLEVVRKRCLVLGAADVHTLVSNLDIEDACNKVVNGCLNNYQECEFLAWRRHVFT